MSAMTREERLQRDIDMQMPKKRRASPEPSTSKSRKKELPSFTTEEKYGLNLHPCAMIARTNIPNFENNHS